LSNSSEGSWLWEQAQKDVVEFSRYAKGPKVRILPSGGRIGPGKALDEVNPKRNTS
jgi:hypothetical protein